jgi:hypothetical protein
VQAFQLHLQDVFSFIFFSWMRFVDRGFSGAPATACRWHIRNYGIGGSAVDCPASPSPLCFAAATALPLPLPAAATHIKEGATPELVRNPQSAVVNHQSERRWSAGACWRRPHQQRGLCRFKKLLLVKIQPKFAFQQAFKASSLVLFEEMPRPAAVAGAAAGEGEENPGTEGGSGQVPNSEAK